MDKFFGLDLSKKGKVNFLNFRFSLNEKFILLKQNQVRSIEFYIFELLLTVEQVPFAIRETPFYLTVIQIKHLFV